MILNRQISNIKHQKMMKPFFSLISRIQFASARIGKLMVLHESTHLVFPSWGIDEKFCSVDGNRIFIQYYEQNNYFELF